MCVCVCIKTRGKKNLRKGNYSEVFGFGSYVDGKLELERLIEEKRSIKILQYFIFHYYENAQQ